MDAHIGENDVDVRYTTWKSKMIRQRERNVQKSIIMASVALPKLSIEIMIVVLGLRPMDVHEVTTEKTCQNYHACKRC
jgi:hypothetical protein